MRTVILGGGLAGISLAHFMQGQTVILEKEKQPGGLCRSYALNEIVYDVGPHAVFSKNKEILSMMTALFDSAVLRRSNRIYHGDRLVKYPFENDLYALTSSERDYCLQEFLQNPYENYNARNMLQFFLKTFGEGITRLYLQPYNEKVWKFDPSFMDMQMVERIPKPPREDVIKSAQGVPTEGYQHQLYFHYPRQGGIEQLIDGLLRAVGSKTELVCPVTIQHILKRGAEFHVETDRGTFTSPQLINCMPLQELFRYIEAPAPIRTALAALQFNSIYIVVVQARADTMGDVFASYVPDKNIIFHRVSKVNFMGSSYCLPEGGSTIMAEITYRPGSYLASLSIEDIQAHAIRDLEALGIVCSRDVIDVCIKSFPYAYVIYDLQHRSNTDTVLSYLAANGIKCCGRFAEFEYLNMDGVFEHTYRLASILNGDAYA